jgi:hypothetical protein
MLFGSDYPLITPDRWLADFEKLEIRDEVRPLVLKENAVRLLRAVSDLGWPLRPAASLFGERVAFGVDVRALADRLSRAGPRAGRAGGRAGRQHARARGGVAGRARAGGVIVSLNYRLAPRSCASSPRTRSCRC